MAWIRHSVSDLRPWQGQRAGTVILMAVGAVCVATASVACGGPAASSPTIPISSAGPIGSATSSAGPIGSATSSTAPSESATSSDSASSCSAQGGDTFSQLACASPSSHSGVHLSGPPTEPLPPTIPPTTPSTTVTVSAAVEVTAISPASGSALGGDSVTITGSGFTGATAVDFGNASAPQETVDSDTQITATTPPGNGTVDVTVVTPTGTSSPSPADQFSYQGAQPS
jgi:IPT/TIG domain